MRREIYDADHVSFRNSVRTFLDREVKPGWDKYIEAKQFPREMWLAFGRQGLLGLEIPEQYGGFAAEDFRYNAVLCEELGKLPGRQRPAVRRLRLHERVSGCPRPGATPGCRGYGPVPTRS